MALVVVASLLLQLPCARAAREVASGPTDAHAAALRPNIVLLFLDDAGWGDFGCNVGNDTVRETPNIDALARGGMRFSDFHAAASVCTPSRAGLLTGRYPARAGIVGNFGPDSWHGMATDEVTVADVLRGAGYDTRMLGKHHLGFTSGYSPTYRGFRTWCGLPYSGDMGCLDATPQSCHASYNRSVGQPACPALCPADGAPVGDEVAIPLYNSTAFNCSGHASCDADIIQQPFNPFELNGVYVAEARRIIAEAAAAARSAAATGAPAEPLFLHVAFAHTHTPLAYSERFANSSTRPGWARVFGDTLAEVDAAVGDIVDALEQHGMRNDTLVVVTADNGPADLASVACDAIGSAGPYVGAWQKSAAGGGGGATEKTTTFEGGHRVVGVASWPGRVPAGVTSDALASTLDLLPTFAALAGANTPSDRELDGVDLSLELLGVGGAVAGHRTLFHQDGDGNLTAGRIGRYKLYWETIPAAPCRKADGTHDPSGKRLVHSPPIAFDLVADPAESTPVSVPAELLRDVEAARSATVASITSTFHSFSNYSTGGSAAWPCCNRASSCCRCH